MLYILPPQSAPSPPSVWDLIINFHRKGTDANAGPSSIKKPIKFDREVMKKSRRSWHKSSSSEPNQSSPHVRVIININTDKKKYTFHPIP
jgi:hypothetical protein